MASETPLLPILREEIRAAGGKITFARFMELCLYHPEYGYYNTERVKLGKHGDFYTSAHLGPVFARLLARHFELLWHELGTPSRFDLVELGPGDGWFAEVLLPWIARRFPEFSSHLHYTAIEQSPVLRTRLKEKLAAFGSRAKFRLAELPPHFIGCIIANEFFDALPVHILVWRQGRWLERYVCLAGENLTWCEGKVSPRAIGFARKGAALFGSPDTEPRENLIAEICPGVGERTQPICTLLGRGEFLIVDYGYSNEDWLANRFPQGSALGYCQHQAVEDLLANPGEQDLTAHVNFSQLIEIGERNGMRLTAAVPISQSRFLMELGEPDEFHDVFADCATDLEWQQRAQQLKTLILPQGMGEAFRVLQLRKGF